MTDFPARRIEAAATRLSFAMLRTLERTKYPEISALDIEQRETLRKRACVPAAMVRLARGLWRRGNTIDGESGENGFW